MSVLPISEQEREPLLGQRSQDETTTTDNQKRLHEKLHTFQMGRALSLGYLPSSAQIIANVEAALASNALEAQDDLSPAGRALVRLAKTWLQELAALIEHKNSGDQLQDLVWWLSQAGDDAEVTAAPARASSSFQGLQAATALLLTNANVRLFLTDVATIGREAIRDGLASGKAGDGVVGDKTKELLGRLKDALGGLRQRSDYEKTVSVLSVLLQKYAIAYAHEAEDRLEEVAQQVQTTLGVDGHAQPSEEDTDEEDVALRNFGSLLVSFGDRAAWKELEVRFGRLLSRSKGDNRQFDAFIHQAGDTLQRMLLDPEFLDHADEHIEALEKKLKALDETPATSAAEPASKDPPSSTIRQDLDALLSQVQVTVQSIADDADLSRLATTTGQMADLLWPRGQSHANSDLLADLLDGFLPMCIQAVQYIPIPRIEIATPAADLLLENLVLEPGATVNDSSFLPYRMQVEVRNDVVVRKARFGRASSLQTTASIALDGLSIAADGVGYRLHLRPDPLQRLLPFGLMPSIADEGLVSFHLDERGMDVHLDVEVIRNQADRVLVLRDVRVAIHRLDYTLTPTPNTANTVVTWLAWLAKPVAVPVIRRMVQRQLAAAVRRALHDINQELVFARERLRAARIANPNGDLVTFMRAITARYKPGSTDDPDRRVRFGVLPSRHGVFADVYAPGSLAEVWKEDVAERGNGPARRHRRDGWRNKAFDRL